MAVAVSLVGSPSCPWTDDPPRHCVTWPWPYCSRLQGEGGETERTTLVTSGMGVYSIATDRQATHVSRLPLEYFVLLAQVRKCFFGAACGRRCCCQSAASAAASVRRPESSVARVCKPDMFSTAGRCSERTQTFPSTRFDKYSSSKNTNNMHIPQRNTTTRTRVLNGYYTDTREREGKSTIAATRLLWQQGTSHKI